MSKLLHLTQRVNYKLKAYYLEKKLQKISTPTDHLYPTGIVFSKDRAIQLHALLSSYFECVTDPAPLKVLYAVSSKEYQKSYQMLIQMFQNKNIQWRKEENTISFKEQLSQIIHSIDANIIFFLVDDIVFKNQCQLSHFYQHDLNLIVPSLRLGKHLNFCYNKNRALPLPSFKSHHESSLKGSHFWEWSDAQDDWNYPLSLDGHFFYKKNIELLISHSEFSSPNSLEAALQIASKYFRKKLGFCASSSVIFNIPCNRIQNEIENPHGSQHQDLLLEKWNDGYRIDYRKFYNFNNTSVHQDVELPLIKVSD